MKYIKHLMKTVIETFKDPQLLSSRPHHGEGSWDCQYCRVTHTIDMTVGDVDSQGNRTCQQCWDDLTMQDINDMSVQSEMDAKSEDYPDELNRDLLNPNTEKRNDQ